MKVYDAVVARLEGICAQRRLSHNQLATLAGISPSSVKNIFNGSSRNPGIVTLKLICDGLQMPLPEFFNHPLFHELEDEME